MWRIRISSGDKNNSGTWHLPLANKSKFSVGRKEGAAQAATISDAAALHGSAAVSARELQRR